MSPKHLQTKIIHNGSSVNAPLGATHTPIFQSAGFAYDSMQELEDVFQGKAYGHYYSRVSNPTVESLEARLAAIEGAVGAVVVSSGMAAISSAILSIAKSGEHIIVSKSLFGSTYYLLKDYLSDCGIEISFVDPSNTEDFKSQIKENTRLFYVETIGNPKLDIPNLQVLANIANEHNIVLIADSTFTTPVLLSAKQLGVHVVIYATTKYIAGGGTTVGGAILDTGLKNWKESSSSQIKAQEKFGRLAFLSAVRKVRANSGVSQSPFNAYLTSLGLDTLSLRMNAHSKSALKVAEFLQTHPKVAHVNYPGLKAHKQHELATAQFNGVFGGMLTIRLGSKQRAFKFIDSLKLTKTLVNLGDAKTLAVYPATTIYRNLTPEERVEAGVYEDLVRVSIGLEHPDDIIEDFTKALEELK